MRDLAERLIAFEAREKQLSGAKAPTAAYVCEKLRPHLATLMGKAGFRAVLSRAVTVASAEVPWLGAVQVNAEGALEGWDMAEARAEPMELRECCVPLIAPIARPAERFYRR